MIFIAAGAWEIVCRRNGWPTEWIARVFVPPACRHSGPAHPDRRHVIVWIISGLWIDFGDVGLHAYNGCGCDGLSAERAQPGYENALSPGEIGHRTLRDGLRGT
ncbi:hypothetical protein [Dactylosporangium sp. NPDC048998]|uniref:hypothetical protein n=1 Tax=Dactylosporangium sp. NPDC048998 TaxID=3363976 RepID=UPI00371236E7